MLYRGPAAAALLVVPLDTLTAVFHRRSGTTHLLAEPAPEILALLAEAALSPAALLAALQDEYDLVDADPAVLAQRLDELVEVGLVKVAAG